MFKIYCSFRIFPLQLQNLHRMRSHQSFLTSVAWSQEQGCELRRLSVATRKVCHSVRFGRKASVVFCANPNTIRCGSQFPAQQIRDRKSNWKREYWGRCPNRHRGATWLRWDREILSYQPKRKWINFTSYWDNGEYAQITIESRLQHTDRRGRAQRWLGWTARPGIHSTCCWLSHWSQRSHLLLSFYIWSREEDLGDV